MMSLSGVHGLQVGRYRLLRSIGSGSLGVVYEGQDEDGGRVAVKILRPEMAQDPLQRARLRQEGEALRRLSHPGIARFLGVEALPDGGVALVMEYLDGVSLRHRMQERPLSVPFSLRVAGEVAAALLCAHENHVVHRDIKPENLMLVPGVDGREQVRVLDFGVAKVAGYARTATGPHTRPETGSGATLGTLRYMAPEQILSPRAADAKSDVFSLGAVLYEMLAGVPAFGAEVPELSLSAAPPPAPAERNEAVPGWISRLVMAMLSRDPRQRPEMARVAEQLATLPEGICPFPGLEPFAEDDAAFFHGREREVAEALALLGPVQGGYRRWLQIEGASGSGKSSLLRAGLLPALRRGIAGRRVVAALVFRPGREPLLNLSQALVIAWPRLGAIEGVLLRLAAPEGLLHLLREVAGPEEAVVLAVDPFEEAFTLSAEGHEGAAQLDRLLGAALGDADGPLHLLTALRSDFLGRLALMPALEQRLNAFAARFHLSPMDRAGLREALLSPCARAGLRCEPGLVERVVADTTGLLGCLPLLGHALLAIYDARHGDLLTLCAYERLGGVAGALANATEALLAGLGAEGRKRARRLLLSLVHIDRGAEDTRRPRDRGEVLAAAGGDAEADRVLDRLSGGRGPGTPARAPAQVRLVVLNGDRVELIHEALLRHMPALRAWVEEDRHLLLRRDDLEQAATAWQAMGRPTEELPEAAGLRYYDDAAALASVAGRTYLAAGRAEERRRSRWRRGSMTLLAAAALGFLGLSGYALQEKHRAEGREVTALEHIEAIQRIVDEELAHLSGTDFARFKLFESADTALRKLAEAGTDGWPLAKARFSYDVRRGDFAGNYRLPPEAAGYYEAALKQADVVAREAPNRPLGRRLGAEGHIEFGDYLLEENHLGDARAHFQSAEGLLAAERDHDGLLLRARAARRLAVLEAKEARYKEAWEQIRRAEGLIAEAGGDESSGFLDYDKGCIALATGDLPAAKTAFATAIYVERPMLLSNRGYLNYPWHLGRILTQDAIVLARLKEDLEARRQVDEAINLLTRIVTDNPGHRQYQRALKEAQEAAVEVDRLAQVRETRDDETH